MYIKNIDHHLIGTKTKIEGNCAYVTLKTAPNTFWVMDSDKPGMVKFDVELPAGVDTLYVQDEIIWQDDNIISENTKKLYKLRCDNITDTYKCDNKIWDDIVIYTDI